METTNFFSGIAAMGITGALQIIIHKGTGNNWVVSVMLHNEQCGDNARKLIAPLNLNGTAQELDEGFFGQVAQPVKMASGLVANMEAYMQQLEVARKQSAMEKEKTEKVKKEKEAKEKKYREAMQKVDELEKAGKHRDAWMKVPEPSDYPEHAEILRKRKSALAAKFAPDLFGAAPAAITETTPEQEDIAEDDEREEDDEYGYQDEDSETEE